MTEIGLQCPAITETISNQTTLQYFNIPPASRVKSTIGSANKQSFKLDYNGVKREILLLDKKLGPEIDAITASALKFHGVQQRATTVQELTMSAKAKLRFLGAQGPLQRIRACTEEAQKQNAENQSKLTTKQQEVTAKRMEVSELQLRKKDLLSIKMSCDQNVLRFQEQKATDTSVSTGKQAATMAEKEKLLRNVKDEIARLRTEKHNAEITLKFQHQQAKSELNICTEENKLLRGEVEDLYQQIKGCEERSKQKRMQCYQKMTEARLLRINKSEVYSQKLKAMDDKLKHYLCTELQMETEVAKFRRDYNDVSEKIKMTDLLLQRLRNERAEIAPKFDVIVQEEQTKKHRVDAKDERLKQQLNGAVIEAEKLMQQYVDKQDKEQNKLKEDEASTGNLFRTYDAIQEKCEEAISAKMSYDNQLQKLIQDVKNARQKNEFDQIRITRICKWKKKFQSVKIVPQEYLQRLRTGVSSLKISLSKLEKTG